MPSDSQDDPLPLEVSGRVQFTTTCWSVVLEAADPECPGSQDAFAQLYQDYWFPLYAYVRRRGWSPHEAEDLTQDFFVSLLEKKRLRGLEREGGRFRSFLLKSLQNFLTNAWDRAGALKRGGGCVVVPLDTSEAEAHFLADPFTPAPEAGFDRNWAFTLIGNAIQNLERELRAGGKEKLFLHLRPHLQGDSNGRPYAEIALELGMSEGAVKVAVHRLRHRCGELLRAEVARTVDRPEELERELSHLMSVVAS